MSQQHRKILVLGANGRLAGSLVKHWSAEHEVTAWGRHEVNVGNLDELEKALKKAKFDILVNGTGMTNVDGCESAREEAERVNALAPELMAVIARKRGARLIHFSTDYVFDGKKQEPYTEEDVPAPAGWYGETKLKGEQLVLADSPIHLVVRVSWVFGPMKPSFIDAILNRALKETRVDAVADKFSSPTYTEDVPAWLSPFLNQDTPGGLYHACNTGSCSWRDYGEKALELAAEAGVPVLTTQVAPLRLAEMKQFIAPRPVYSILSTRKLASVTGITPRHWHEALRDYIFNHYAPILSKP
jgi:dTDP-4-dehydrorhamnose reductase